MKRSLFIIVSILCSMATIAQEVNPEKEKIDSLKLSENAVYAEVIEMLTDDNEAVSLAQQKSINLLQAHVVEIFAKRMNMEKKDVQEIWDVIDDKCQNIVVKRGDLLRVFSYVMKDALGLTPSKPKQKDLEMYINDREAAEVSQEASVVVQKDINLLAEAKPVVAQPQQVVQAQQEAQPQQTVQPQQVVQPKETVQPQQATQPQPVIQPRPVAQPQPVVEEKVAIEVPAFIQPILDMETYKDLVGYLRKERNRTLMYGSQNDMQNHDRCYVAIVEKKTSKVIAILGKGKTERANYKSLSNDNLENYQGKNKSYAAIFIQEY